MALLEITFGDTDRDMLPTFEGRIAGFIAPGGKLDPMLRRLNKLTRGSVSRVAESAAFEKAKAGDVISISYPAGLDCCALDIVKLDRRPETAAARRAGAELAKRLGSAKGLLIAAGSTGRIEELAFGLAMRAYEFKAHQTAEAEDRPKVTIMTANHEDAAEKAAPLLAVAEGAHFTRDLVNEPANILTTTEFAKRLAALKDIGVEVEELDEKAMQKLGMNALLSVGHGSVSPSKLVIMRWVGGQADAAPLALVGKGVVFDTGGISLKPAAGMEDMTMDMGGAGVVAGVMRALALRKAKANVVGVVGLVENMPSDRATRPGDVVTSMKGDTIEIINTDAEGRLVLCDALWYTQEKLKPAGIIDLATLTGAIIIGLGHDNAGLFSNDDAFVRKLIKSADAEGEGVWQLPLGQCYDDLLKSRIADMKNVGGRAAGSITAAQFLKRFIQDGMPWVHIDIAGVASVKTETALAPKGATGWGVATLNRFIADHFEG